MKAIKTYPRAVALGLVLVAGISGLALTDISEGYSDNSPINTWALLALLLIGFIFVYAATFYLILRADTPVEEGDETYAKKRFNRFSDLKKEHDMLKKKVEEQ